ncbi:MAG TPA: YggS family pyridoxal phosphate-dependent enzyme [Candidatus Acidoferrales bacterium]|nr:YggS family pyridoxal phosphate-dependent enzyme [Candidatus Acidoferrales bacterium]
MAIDHSAVAANLAGIRERIARAAARAGRPAEDVTIVAISKTFPASAIRAAWDAGVRHFGENRVQEWEGKRAEVADLAATWHLVGHLQSNKARRAAQNFTAIDSVDSLDLARRLDATLREEAGAGPDRGLRVLLEVRLAPEETKSGVPPEALEDLARSILGFSWLNLRGLMCIPPFFEQAEQARPYFRRLRELRHTLRSSLAATPAAQATAKRGQVLLPVLSMGMSHDFEVAIEEGATEVRIGTALFGSRG